MTIRTYLSREVRRQSDTMSDVMPRVARHRRPQKGDDISERCHIDELEDHVLWELGHQLSEVNGGKSLWRWLASELGLERDSIARIRSHPNENPGYEVIRCWSKRDGPDGSTIRVLKNVLRDVLKRSDLVATIDKARLS